MCPHTSRLDERERPCSMCLLAPTSRKINRIPPPRVTAIAVQLQVDDEIDDEQSRRAPRDTSPTRPLGTTRESAIQAFLAAVDGGYRVASPTAEPRTIEAPGAGEIEPPPDDRPEPLEALPPPRVTSNERWRAMRAAQRAAHAAQLAERHAEQGES